MRKSDRQVGWVVRVLVVLAATWVMGMAVRPARAQEELIERKGPPPSDDLFIYPQSGQSPDQQANDKYECHKWAASQTGFDPTQSAGGVPPDQAAAKGADYQRAMRACPPSRQRTPTARFCAKMTPSTRQPVSSRRLGRCSTGLRKAVAADQRRPRF